MKLRPTQWLLYSPVAVLPFLAALVLNGGPRGLATAEVFDFHGTWLVVTSNWVWMLVALGLGIWFGWAANTGRR